MKGFLYFLGGLCAFTEISMFMRATTGIEEFTTFYIFIMLLIGYIGFICFSKASKIISAVTSAKVENLVKADPYLEPAPVESQSSENILKSKKDYLIESGLDKKILVQDSIRIYLDILEEDDTSDQFKEVISEFLMPYKISLIKFGFNKEFYNLPGYMKNSFLDHDLDFMENNYKYISPSFKLLSKNPDYFVKGYPEFFFIAFPDVVYWALETEVIKVNQLLSFYKNEELIEDGYLRDEIIKKIINLYLKSTNKELECRIIDHYQLL